jgi:hypothetical protein
VGIDVSRDRRFDARRRDGERVFPELDDKPVELLIFVPRSTPKGGSFLDSLPGFYEEMFLSKMLSISV